MRKQLLILLLISIANVSYSQNVLDGIFRLRLGMSEEDISKIVKLKKPPYSILGVESDRFAETEEYSPIEGFTIKKIEFKFLEGELYRIEVREYNENLEDLLTEKYGKPKKKEYDRVTKKTYAERTSEYDLYNQVSSECEKTWKTRDKNVVCKSKLSINEADDSKYYTLEIKDQKLARKAAKTSIEYVLNKKRTKIDEKDKKKLLEEI